MPRQRDANSSPLDENTCDCQSFQEQSTVKGWWETSHVVEGRTPSRSCTDRWTASAASGAVACPCQSTTTITRLQSATSSKTPSPMTFNLGTAWTAHPKHATHHNSTNFPAFLVHSFVQALSRSPSALWICCYAVVNVRLLSQDLRVPINSGGECADHDAGIAEFPLLSFSVDSGVGQSWSYLVERASRSQE